MRRRQRRGTEDTNISFLDVICCGFGAIVLLMVIVKPNAPIVIEESPIVLDGQIKELQRQLFEIRGQVRYLERELNAKHEQLGKDNRRVAILRSEFDELNSRVESIDDDGGDIGASAADLEVAVQSLTAEMRRLLRDKKNQNNYIGGVPVDSEYIIFIIDTSGSMIENAWGRMVNVVINTLKVYPTVKGIQVINTNGQYLFGGSAGQWMKDSPSRRQQIAAKLPTWTGFSPSTPVGGITAALRRFYDRKKKISLYVLGDDFTGRSVSRVLDIVATINEANDEGETLVRIHAIGFPVFYPPNGASPKATAARFAALMRRLAEQNNGTFVGLDRVR